MHSLQLLQSQDIQSLFSIREGEKKVGQTILLPETKDWKSWLANQSAKFVILGMPEDIGVRANGGLGGTQTAWLSFLKAFLNIQDNVFLKGKHMILLGSVQVQSSIEKYATESSVPVLREGVQTLDELLYPIIEAIVNARKIPILIGGGHNNAYPLLKGFSLAKGNPVNVINMDAHADFRAMEGRHSGNGFKYAYHENYLKKYAAFGLHEAYNNTEIIQQFQQNPDLKAIWFESIYLRNEFSFEAALEKALHHVEEQSFGVELDLDCIEDTLSSAQSPIGFSRLEAWQYIYKTAQHKKSGYLHLTEGVALREDGFQYPMIGKLLSYCVQAFIKGKSV